MICPKCGKEIDNNAKFCTYCGLEIAKMEKATVKETKKAEEKKEVKKEKVEAIKVEEKKEAPRRSNGLGIAGMIIGIVSTILSFILTIFIIVFPIAGLILSLCSKGKKGFKIAGIITNALAIVLSIILCIVYAASIGKLFGSFAGILGNSIKSVYPYGEWTCVSYYGTSAKTYEDNVKLAPSEDKTILKLNSNGTFTYGPYVDSYKNYYKGDYTYELETEKNQKSGQKYSFMDVKTTINDAMIDGVVDYNAKEMHFEMELIQEKDYNTALIMFYNNYNTYYCQR